MAFTKETARAWGQAGALTRWAKASPEDRAAQAARMNASRDRYYREQVAAVTRDLGLTLSEKDVAAGAHRLMLAHMARARALLAEKKARGAA